MTFLTILGSFRLVLEAKTGKEIPEPSRLEFLEKFLADNCFIRCKRQHLRATQQRRYSRFNFFENAIGNLPKVLRAKFVGSDGLFCVITVCMFSSFKNPFATNHWLPKLYFSFRRFILLVQTKKSNFYVLWQQHKYMKTMEMSEA